MIAIELTYFRLFLYHSTRVGGRMARGGGVSFLSFFLSFFSVFSIDSKKKEENKCIRCLRVEIMCLLAVS